MMMWLGTNREKEKGFTLVELIVVMAILAVLAALAVPRFTGILGQAKDDANDVNKATIERAAEMYVATSENFTLPTGEGTASIDISDLVKENYLKGNTGTEEDPSFEGPNKEKYTIEVDSKGNVTVDVE